MTAITIQLASPITCCVCGTPFAMGRELRLSRLDDHRSFFCPNGHAQSFTGPSEATRLKQELQWERDTTASLRGRLDQAEGSLRATKGHVTRLRNRAAAGECPFGCNRRFPGLSEHIAKKHPGEHLEGE